MGTSVLCWGVLLLISARGKQVRFHSKTRTNVGHLNHHEGQLASTNSSSAKIQNKLQTQLPLGRGANSRPAMVTAGHRLPRWPVEAPVSQDCTSGRLGGR